MSSCQSCGAAITWITSGATKKALPLDSAPVIDGNVVVRGDPPVAVVLTRAELAQPPLVPEPRYRSHFVTCPQAASWRGTTRGPSHAA